MQKEQKRGPFFARAPPVRRLPASAGLGASQKKNGHFGTLTTHFLRETSTHMMRVTAAAPQRFVRGTYLPTLLILYQCGTSALTLLAPARLPYMLGRVVLSYNNGVRNNVLGRAL